MNMTQTQYQFLINRLCVEKKPITAKFLSRTWNIPAVQASEIMIDFYDKHKQDDQFKNLDIKYSICGSGKLIPSQRKVDILVKIVNSHDLEKIKNELFANIISCQIYSMHLYPNVSLSNINEACNISSWVYSNENMEKCGILRTTTDGVLSGTNKTESAPIPNEQPAVRVKTEPLSNKDSGKVIKNIEKKPSNVEENRRPVYVSRKASSTPSSNSTNTTAEVKKPIYTSRKGEKRSNNSSNVSLTDRDNKKKPKVLSEAERKKKEEEMKELEMMFEDGFSDDDDDDNNNDDSKKNKDLKQKTEYKYDDIDIAEPDEDEKKNIFENDEKSELEPSTNLVSEENDLDDDVEVETDSIPAEKLGDIEDKPEVETYVDADGYVVRKVNKKAVKPIPSTTPAKISYTIEKKPASSVAKKQSNLMSFFKKK